MLGNFLMTFFIVMPAVVMFVKRDDVQHPVSRGLLRYGGAVAMICAALVVLPLLACNGSMISGYTSCVGGAGPSALVAQAQPMIILAGKLYILVGIPLAVLAFALDQTRRAQI